MVWFLSGARDQLHIGIEGNGAMSVWGSAAHDPRPALDTDVEVLNHLRRTQCSWSVLSPAADEFNLLIGGEAFRDAVKENPGDTHISIRYLAEPSPLIGVTIVLPELRLLSVVDLFKSVLLTQIVGYSITLDFVRFRDPQEEIPAPTAQEFFAGRPYLATDVSFALRAITVSE